MHQLPLSPAPATGGVHAAAPSPAQAAAPGALGAPNRQDRVAGDAAHDPSLRPPATGIGAGPRSSGMPTVPASFGRNPYALDPRSGFAPAVDHKYPTRATATGAGLKSAGCFAPPLVHHSSAPASPLVLYGGARAAAASPSSLNVNDVVHQPMTATTEAGAGPEGRGTPETVRAQGRTFFNCSGFSSSFFLLP